METHGSLLIPSKQLSLNKKSRFLNLTQNPHKFSKKMANKPKRLLEKYDLLLEHLDFGYIGRCSDGVELERIVKVLRSGEEGFFPQLTEFAEQQLRRVKPGSKLFRRGVWRVSGEVRVVPEGSRGSSRAITRVGVGTIRIRRFSRWIWRRNGTRTL
uniref:Sperm-associated antigen 1 n=1 Tax=Culex pipiens TaxID=7175 RepID=A0A8D8G5A3_CULPI